MPLPTLRFLTCGSVDDGKSTLIGRLLYERSLIFDDHARQPGARFEKIRHDRRGGRFRAAGRRPGGRARTGHHHRRRLPLFLDGEPLVHRRRLPRPRAIYPQHGDRRLQLRPRHPPGGRAKRPSRPDPPPRQHRVAAGHPPRGAGGQQDGPRRLRPGRVRAHCRGFQGCERHAEFRDGHAHSAFGAARRQCLRRFRAHALVQGAGPPEFPGAGRCRGSHGRPSAAFPGPMGQPSQSRLSRHGGNARLRAASPGATKSSSPPRGKRRASPASSPWTATWSAPKRPIPSPWCSPTRSTPRAATCCAIRSTGPMSPTSSRRI